MIVLPHYTARMYTEGSTGYSDFVKGICDDQLITCIDMFEAFKHFYDADSFWADFNHPGPYQIDLVVDELMKIFRSGGENENFFGQ